MLSSITPQNQCNMQTSSHQKYWLIEKLEELLFLLGKFFLEVARDVGGFLLIIWKMLFAFLPPRIDMDELLRCMHKFGIGSLPIILVTAGFVGGIMVLQGATYVEYLGAHSLIGWFTGVSTMSEVGPVFIGLMFSGRVGANNTAELASMKVTEQITALKVLAIDPFAYLVVPRFIAMVLTLSALIVFGDIAALITGSITAYGLMGVTPDIFYQSFINYADLGDFTIGVIKGAVFGGAIAVASSHYGLSAEGSAQSVGRSVNAQVVGSAVLVFALDYFMTSYLV